MNHNGKNVGLVGIGKLGTAMMQNWFNHNKLIGVYHPIKSKAEQFIQRFPNGHYISEHELGEIDVLILALPATDVIPFITDLTAKNNLLAKTYIINMATALNTIEIKNKFPLLNSVGVKYMGHARDLLEHGNGLFITESNLPKQIEELFHPLGQIIIDSEETLIQVNRLATHYAVKAAIELKSEFVKRKFPLEYAQKALISIAPEVIRSYCEGNLGDFAKEIAKDIQMNVDGFGY
ncbi:NAD(P)-binding domain-containing protein [Bacillus benzoevorans]|uniref:Pyrroline-5-carboxylate reductase n=1 Tax=Bacillus benzoevorans TaxID=1456 RepID=A0A7X0LU12_9BACI|nr:NAD(P)-binding domain-containing protein [Bacillus benzoevorans]MBB6444461.1 pyrroline-5-carboxylate reductase [Bacillus benzoevorans]